MGRLQKDRLLQGVLHRKAGLPELGLKQHHIWKATSFVSCHGTCTGRYVSQGDTSKPCSICRLPHLRTTRIGRRRRNSSKLSQRKRQRGGRNGSPWNTLAQKVDNYGLCDHCWQIWQNLLHHAPRPKSGYGLYSDEARDRVKEDRKCWCQN